MRRSIAYTLLIVGVLIVFFFSWIPQPRLSLLDLLPDWLSRWTDDNANMNIRTAIPFVFLGIVAATWLRRTKQSWAGWMAAWLGLGLVVIIAEAGQLFLPLRHFDWGDIAWGIAGSTAGLLITAGLLFLLPRIRAVS